MRPVIVPVVCALAGQMLQSTSIVVNAQPKERILIVFLF
jgi:hypothetical protein